MEKPAAECTAIARVRAMHAIFLASVALAAAVVALLPKLGFTPLLGGNTQPLRTVEIGLGAMSVLFVLMGWRWPGLATRPGLPTRSRQLVITMHVTRVSWFEGVAVFGLMLGLLGSQWIVTAPLFTSAGAALVLTFPTDRRLAQWQGKQAPS